MKRRDDRVYLTDILVSIGAIEKYVSGIDLQKLLEDEMRQDALVRQFTVLGEAASRLSSELTRAFPEVEWSEMKGVRNKIVHDYDEIDHLILWETARDDLPRLRDQVTKIAALLGPKPPYPS